MCGPNIITERLMKVVNLIAALSLAAFAATSVYAQADKKPEDKDKAATMQDKDSKDKDKAASTAKDKDKAGAGATTKPEEKKESK